MRPYLLLSLLPLAVACSSPEPTATATGSAPLPNSATAPPEPMDTARAITADAQADTLLTARRRHAFSGAVPDVFSLVLRGSSVLSAEATFTITTASGDVIFREMLSSPDLEAALAYEMKGPTATQAEREAYVRKRIQEFFAEKNFRRPAVAETATFPPAAEAPAGLDQTVWTDLQRRPDAVGFQYLVGKENRRTIAWSPLRKQVIHLVQ